jgi:hypothetical protein
MSLFSFASLGGIELSYFRLRGVGLANCLFPWARCVLASEKFGLRRIASTWPQLCHRQWIRGDRDKRSYIGLIDEGAGAVGGLSKLALLASRPRIAERDFLCAPESFQRGVVVFRGIDGYFESMLDDYEIVRRALITSTRPKHKDCLERGPLSGICIHVRYGDATDPDGPNANALTIPYHFRQRMSWFIHALNDCRRCVGEHTPALVFSDASEEELRPLLALPNVRRAFFGSAIADLLAMSTAPVLVASSSTFSMWAAYLGRMPTIWPAGQRRQRLHPDKPAFEPELGFDRLSADVASLLRYRNPNQLFAEAHSE